MRSGRVAGIIVVGASAGGVSALQTLVADLPADLPLPVAIVLHIGAHRSQLPWLLRTRTALDVVTARDGMPLAAGAVVIAPPDHHLVVDGNVFRTLRGPRENMARPAIDPLFRSAAEYFGPRAIGVVMTGLLNDGSSGLFEIKRRGGLAIVQDPSTADQPGMPESAIRHVAVDYILKLQDIGRMLGTLAAAMHAPDPVTEVGPMHAENERFKPPIALVCPDCGGAMETSREDGMPVFRCHTGHRVTGQVLAADQLLQIETHVESTIRLLHEAAALARDFQAAAVANADPRAVESWRQSEEKMDQAMQRVLQLSDALPRPDELDLT